MNALSNFPILLLAGLLAACTGFDHERPEGPKRMDTTLSHSPADSAARIRTDTTVYVTAVEFPTGYDWQRDTAGRTAACRLVVFAGVKRILELPVGDAFGISPDPDMHRLRGGHLYTDFSTDTETLVKKDGEELFRFDGREMFCGFLVQGEDILTLGQNRRGAGVTLRRNGVPVFSDPQGYTHEGYASAFPCGALNEDQDELCFSYYRLEDSKKTWFLVRDGIAGRVEVPDEVQVVHDVRRLDGRTCLVAVVSGIKASPVLYVDGVPTPLGPPESHTLNDGRLGFSGGWIRVKCRIKQPRERISTSYLFSPYASPVSPGTGQVVSDFFLEGTDVAYAVLDASDGVVSAWHKGVSRPIDGASHLIAPGCGQLAGGALYLALTPFQKGYHPRLWKEGQETTYPINGYLTSVRVE